MSELYSTIKLYAGVPFTPDKNFEVDDLTAYLAALPDAKKLSFTKANYIKHRLSLSVTLELEQESLDYYEKNWNYCEITNGPLIGVQNLTTYYFIINKQWRSKKVVQLDLFMDTINTLYSYVQLTDKTIVKREHKDRYTLKNSSLYASIDKVSEGFSPILHKADELDLKPKGLANQFKWYMVYLNKNDISTSDFNQVNPVRVGIAASHGISAYTDGSYTLSTSYYTMISPLFNNTNGAGLVRLDSNTYIPVRIEAIDEIDITSINYSTYPTTKYIVRWADCYKVGGDWKVISHASLYDEDMNLLNDASGVLTGTTIALLNFNGAVQVHESGIQHTSPNLDPNNTLYGSTIDFTGIDELDKTDQSLLKIVELPYCPVKVLKITSQGYYIFELPINEVSKTGSNYKFFEIKGKNLNYLENELVVYDDPLNFLLDSVGELVLNISDISKTEQYTERLDPKSLKSEFTGLKFVYDTFSKDLALEDADIEALTGLTEFRLKEITSLALTSKFMFDTSEMFPLHWKKEDYSSIIPVSRNNEVCIYNNQYLNYLRTSLQYDLKAKNEQMQENITRGVMAGIGALAAVGVGVATGGAGAIGAAIGGGLAGAQNVYTIFNSEAKAQEALEAKQAQLKAQKSSVIGADDLGLLHYYTKGNWAKLCSYFCTNEMYEKINSLFHFTGYTSERQGKPVTNNRLRFNYVMADIDIDTNTNYYYLHNYPNEVIEDYKARFAAGLTIIHHYDSTWDFEQKYNNWESFLDAYL